MIIANVAGGKVFPTEENFVRNDSIISLAASIRHPRVLPIINKPRLLDYGREINWNV